MNNLYLLLLYIKLEAVESNGDLDGSLYNNIPNYNQ